MSTVGDTMSTLGDVQYTGFIMSTVGDTLSTPGGYHQYTRGLP